MLALSYYLAAQIGLRFATVGDAVTPVWPPTGIAVFVLATFGLRLWPAVAAAAFAVNIPLFGVAAAVPVAAGNTVAVLLAAEILRRRDFDATFARLRDTVALLIAAAVGMTLSATIGVLAMLAADLVAVDRVLNAWMVWWSGDSLGVLLIAPALWAARRMPVARRERVELGMTLAATAILLLGSFAIESPGATLARLLPLYAAWRFGLAGGALAALIAAAAAVFGAGRGWDTFAGADIATTMLRVQGLALTAGVASLVVASLRSEQDRDRAALVAANEMLEDRVRERTSELAQAQRVARLGSFEWQVSADRVTWSDALYELLGLDPATTTPSLASYLTVVHPEDRSTVRDKMIDTLRGHATFSADHRLIRPDGRLRWVHAKGRMALAPDGSVERVFGTVQDITQRKAAEHALEAAVFREQEAAARQAELALLRDRMLAAVSHELRTPLTVVIGMAATLRREEILRDPDVARDLIERLETQAKRLERMLGDLLDLDRLERGTLRTRRVPTDIHALARHVSDRLGPTHHTVLVDAVTSIAPVDASQIERVIDNLLRNALRHTPEGSTVWIRSRQRPDATVLTVEDDGPGVPDTVKGEIFDVFWQNGDEPASPGAGLGLALVAKIAAAHGGRAWVTDRPGGGAAFHVEFAHRTGEAHGVVAS